MMISMINLKERVRRERHDTISALLIMVNTTTFGSIFIIFGLGLCCDLMKISTNGITAKAMIGLLETLIPITAYTLVLSIGVWTISKLISKVGK